MALAVERGMGVLRLQTLRHANEKRALRGRYETLQLCRTRHQTGDDRRRQMERELAGAGRVHLWRGETPQLILISATLLLT